MNRLYGESAVGQSNNTSPDRQGNNFHLKPEKGQSINRIASKLQEKDLKSKNQEYSIEEDRLSQRVENNERPFGELRSNMAKVNLRLPQQPDFPARRSNQDFDSLPEYITRGRPMLQYSHHNIHNSRRRSNEEFHRPDSPGTVPMGMHHHISQSFSPEHPVDYEDGTKKRKRYDDEASELEDLEQFAKDFKQKRIKMGFTQGDVGVAMGKFYGNDFSQTTISRFEALNLSVKNMCKLKPLLEQWLVDVNRAISRGDHGEARLALTQPMISMHPQQSQGRRRKKRTSIPTEGKSRLEDAFNRNPKPTSEEICKFSEDLKMDREVIRVWFCNRRQKQKRITMQQQDYYGEDPSSPVPVSPSGYAAPHSGEGQGSPVSSEEEAYISRHQAYAKDIPFSRSEVALVAARSAVNVDNVPKAVSAMDPPPVLGLPLGSQQLPPRPDIIQSRLSGGFPGHLRPPPSFSPRSIPMRGEST